MKRAKAQSAIMVKTRFFGRLLAGCFISKGIEKPQKLTDLSRNKMQSGRASILLGRFLYFLRHVLVSSVNSSIFMATYQLKFYLQVWIIGLIADVIICLQFVF